MPSVRRSVLIALLLWSPLASASMVLRPAVTQRGNYGETFTFIADLDDGSYLQLSLGLTNIGPGSLKAICRALVVLPEGKPWRADARSGRDGWSWSDGGGAERLSMGPCSASLDDRGTTIDVPVEGASIRLVYDARAVRRTLSDATFAVGDDFYRAEILLYRARVSGTVTLPGGSARAVTGAGYVDHTRSTIRPRDLAERWVRFRALRGEHCVVLLGRRALDGRFTPVWACDAPGHCHHFPSFAMERTNGNPAPSFRVAFADDRDTLEIRSSRFLYRDAPVEDLGVLGKVVAPFVGSPITYVYRARLASNGKPPVDGILEVELSSE